ncbi:MAG: formyltransferase family protein, partial [Robiginitalea sp.]
ETTTGVTTFFIDEQIDTGNILLQKSTEIGREETAGELHDRLMKTGAALVVDTVEMIAAGPVNTTRQKHITSVKNAPKLGRENSRISWDQTDMVVYNKIRGLSPYPGAWTELENNSETLRIKIFRASPADIRVAGVPGQLKVTGQHLFACTGKGWLELLEIQLPGKRRMTVREVLNGMNLPANACFR